MRGILCVIAGIVLLVAGGPPAMAEDLLRPVPLDQVRVGGEIGRRIAVTIDNNLLNLDLDKDFLAPFRERTQTGGYTGLGKLIDALVRFAAYTGDTRIIERKNYAVSALLATQEADGYLGAFVPGSRLWQLWDIHEISYLIYGLTMDYLYFGAEGSLTGAKKAADYIIRGWSAAPDKQPGDGGITVYMAVTGLENALLALHEASGDKRYLDFCTGQRGLADWDGPIVQGRWGPIQGHAYAYLCRSIAQLRLYRIDPNPALLKPTHRALDFITREDGFAITGGCGQHECWTDTQEGAANLSETCTAAYMLRWLDELIRIEDKPCYGDLMDRIVHNTLFAAQSPEGRKIRYYAPFEGPRVYFDKDTYCCPCNYRRIVAELPSLIYYQNEAGVTVNLYTPSSVEVELDSGVKLNLSQETAYPGAGDVLIRVNPEVAAEFTLRLRIPAWAANAKVTVNGAPWGEAAGPGTYLSIEREWYAGDTVQLDLARALRLVRGRKAQAGRVAILYGPAVFCLNREQNPQLAGADLRMLTLDPATLAGPFPDDSVRPGGMKCTVQAWRTTSWYPSAATDFELVLSEFPDPGGEATYFHVPNPDDVLLVDDELLSGTG